MVPVMFALLQLSASMHHSLRGAPQLLRLAGGATSPSDVVMTTQMQTTKEESTSGQEVASLEDGPTALARATPSKASSLSLPAPQLLAIPALWLTQRYFSPATFVWIGRIASALACLSVVIRGLLDRDFYLPRGASRRSPISWAHRKVKRAFNKLIMGTITASILKENNWGPLVPALNASPRVSAADFGAGGARANTRVHAAHDSRDQWKIIDSARHLQPRVAACMEDALCGDESLEAQAAKRAMIEELVSTALPHITIPGRPPLTLEDCYIFSCAQERGAYFPHVHWDTEYLAFPEVEAFQLWFLIENDEPTGNMFMASTPDLSSSDAPCRYVVQSDGSVLKVHHDASDDECPMKRFATAEDAGLRFEYLDMKPGDCLIFSKRTLHMSDPRPHLEGTSINRLAMNVRILVKPAARDTFNVWLGHRYFSLMSKMKKLAAEHVERDAETKEPIKVGGYKQVRIPDRAFLTALQ